MKLYVFKDISNNKTNYIKKIKQILKKIKKVS